MTQETTVDTVHIDEVSATIGMASSMLNSMSMYKHLIKPDTMLAVRYLLRDALRNLEGGVVI